jgi:hypothetical protein
MHFDGDAFISYAHLDNQELVEGRKGWVANLHRALEIRVGQLLGKEPHIWRDPKLAGNDFFAETLIERLGRVAVLVAIVSPRYIKSEWTRKELLAFWEAAEEQGGVRLQQKARIFKVLKTPVPLALHPPELQALLGYEFFKIDPETGRVRELDEVFGADAQRDFWIRLDDLAHEICGLLERLEASGDAVVPTARPERGTVFLAETTSDLREQRETIRRDLQQHGYTVLPAQPLPHVAADLRAAVRADLAHCRMSVHLFGQNFSVVPEGGAESLVEIQNDVAIEQARGGGFFRLLWIPQGITVVDERQRAVLDRLRNDPRLEEGADILETYLEDFRTLVHQRLEAAATPAPAPVPSRPAAPVATAPAAASPEGIGTVYMVYDPRDAEVAAPWADILFDQQLEVLHPVVEGDEAEVREYHEENLRTCDGLLLFYGAAGEVWVRRKLRELQKSAGYGRTKPAPAVAICLVPPKTAEKDRFRTHEAMVIRLSDGDVADPLAPFIARVRRDGGGAQG